MGKIEGFETNNYSFLFVKLGDYNLNAFSSLRVTL